jgi:hypothetical protein
MNPHEDEPGEYFEFNGRTFGPCYSIDESALKARASYIRYEMNVLTDRVMKIKDVVPPEPHKPKPRWRFWRNSQ